MTDRLTSYPSDPSDPSDRSYRSYSFRYAALWGPRPQ